MKLFLAADEPKDSREKRQLFYTYVNPIATYRANWATRGIGETCLTSTGILASCQTFKTCYPYFKAPEHLIRFPNLNAWDYWVLGNSDTCSYYADDGRQAFGVCCTNPVQEAPTAPPSVDYTDEQKFEAPHREPPFQSVGFFGGMAWPPPIPTHPPDHAGIFFFIKI